MKYRLLSLRVRLLERARFKVAWLLPKWLVYFASIRMIAHATSGKYGNENPTYVGAMDALKRWDWQ